MGLFSNNKKLCPLCGTPTPRLLPTKVEGMALCKDCANKLDLPDNALDAMTVADVEQYMAVYEENRPGGGHGGRDTEVQGPAGCRRADGGGIHRQEEAASWYLNRG